MTPHIESKKEDIADIVLMPGDPLRGKYIAENFLEDTKIVNTVRNETAFTGYYKGKKVTVFPSGMGMPSIGIYSYELYRFYDVKNIIRIGSCGALSPDLKLLDTVLSTSAYTEGNYALAMTNKEEHLAEATPELNQKIRETANEINVPIVEGNTLTNEFFDLYLEDFNLLLQRLPQDLNICASEMEAFALFYNAKQLNKNAACLLTVVDSKYANQSLTPEERQLSLNNMIKLALETAIKY